MFLYLVNDVVLVNLMHNICILQADIILHKHQRTSNDTSSLKSFLSVYAI